MKKIFILVIFTLLCSQLFAGDFVIKNGVLLKYNGNAKNLVIPNGVKTIGKNAFNVCIDKKTSKYKNFQCETMTIPASVTNIEWTGPGYFSHKTSGYWNAPMPLKSIVVDKNNKVYASFDGVLYTKDKKKLIYYPPYKKDTSYIIPSFVTYIGSFAFYCCKYLTELTIPDNVLRIKVGAVQANLTKLTISNPNLNVEKGAFQYLDTEKCEIKIPSELYDTFYKPLWDSEGSFAICNVP